MKKKSVIYFLLGFATSAIILPMLESLGVPTFNTVLKSLFGDNKAAALLFSVVLVAVVLFGLIAFSKSKKAKEK